MKQNLSFVDFLLYIILISVVISPVFALGAGNRNLLLIGVMSASPLIIIRCLECDKNDLFLCFFSMSIILFPMLNHPETIRWSTVMYSLMFCLNFMALARLLRHSTFSIEQYFALIKWLLYAYAIVLVIQQFCVLTGLPIFNRGNYNPAEPWKLNSLAAEPSHSARIMGLLMYCYIVIKEAILKRSYRFELDFKSDRWVWFSFFWTMFTMGSGTAFLFVFIVLSKFVRLQTILSIVLISIGIFVVANFLNISSAQRTYEITKATLTLDENTIMKTDGSAGSRIIPLIILSKIVSVFDRDDLLGHGVDQASKIRVINMKKYGHKDGVGGTLLTLWYEYGFIAFLIFTLFSFSICYNKDDKLASIIFWFFLVFMYGVNNQIVWACIILSYVNKNLKRVATNENKTCSTEYP